MLASDKKADYLQIVYREFSRQRANHYQLQYPRLNAIDIARFVCEEWEELNEEEHEKLFSECCRKGLIVLRPTDDNYLEELGQEPPRITIDRKEDRMRCDEEDDADKNKKE